VSTLEAEPPSPNGCPPAIGCSKSPPVPDKHLLTIESGISVDQTATMRDRRLQLVVPHAIHATYTPEQRTWLWTLRAFLEFAKRTQ